MFENELVLKNIFINIDTFIVYMISGLVSSIITTMRNLGTECNGKKSLQDTLEPNIYFCQDVKNLCEYRVNNPNYNQPLCHYNVKNFSKY